MKKHLNILLFFSFLIFFICSSFIYAYIPKEPTRITSQTPIIGFYTFEVGFPGIAPGGKTMSFPKEMDPFVYIIVTFVNLALRLSGIVLFIILVYSGIMYSLSGGDPKKKQEAQKRIIEAIIGFFLLFGFYIILNTINPDILKKRSTTAPVIYPSNETNPGYAENPVIPSTETPSSGNYINIKHLGLPLTDELNSYPAVYLDSTLATQLALALPGNSFIITDACVRLNSDGTCNTTISRESNDCHRYGKCVDIDNQGSTTLRNLRDMAAQGNLAVLDEGNHLHVTTPNITYPPYWGGVDYSDCISGGYQWYIAGKCPK